jgi:uncharacterized membrane protein
MNRIRVASAISFGGLALAAAGFILAIAFTTAAHTGWTMIGVGIFVAIAASATGVILRPRVRENAKGGFVALVLIVMLSGLRIS